MKAIFSVVLVVVVLGFGWWYMQGTNTESVAGDEVVADMIVVDGDVRNADADTVVEDMQTTGDFEGDIEMKEIPTAPAVMSVKKFNITAKNFEFSQKEIRVKKGEKVSINFESTGGLHDWVNDEFKAHTEQVRPGTKTSATFVADKVGTFEFYCSVGEHRAMGMKGNLIVE